MKKIKSGVPIIISQADLDFIKIKSRRQREYWEATREKTREFKAEHRAMRHKIALTLSSQRDWKKIMKIAEEKKKQKQGNP